MKNEKSQDEFWNACTAPKKNGEARVIILAGNYWHNGMMYETHWRSVLAPTGWKLLFPQSAFCDAGSIDPGGSFHYSTICR